MVNIQERTARRVHKVASTAATHLGRLLPSSLCVCSSGGVLSGRTSNIRLGFETHEQPHDLGQAAGELEPQAGQCRRATRLVHLVLDQALVRLFIERVWR